MFASLFEVWYAHQIGIAPINIIINITLDSQSLMLQTWNHASTYASYNE
jgi:hypothetical protein